MKKLISMIAVAALLMTGCAKELKVTPAENLKVEYGEKLDNTKLFNVKESDENVKVDKVEGFDAKKLGEQEITVTFADGEREKEGKVIITVEDTKKPAIELKKESVSITAGDKLVLKDNIKSVKDPVDGDLKYSEKAVEKDGYYIDKGKLDTKKAGTYDVKVIAADKNGNKTEKSFKVIVKKKETAKKPSTNNSGNGYSANTPTNNSGFSSSKPSNSGNNNSSNGGSSSGGSSSYSENGNSSSNNNNSSVNYDPKWENADGSCHHGHFAAFNDVWFNNGDELDEWALDYLENVLGHGGTWGALFCPNCGKCCITTIG